MLTNDEIKTWRSRADHYAKRAGEHTDPSSQLACLILADYCVYEWSGDRGGPTQEMIQLAESILGVSLDKTISGLMTENTPVPPASRASVAPKPKPRPRNVVLVASSIEVHCPYCDAAQPAPGGSEFCETLEAKEMCDGSVRLCVSCDAQIRMIWNNKVQAI